MNTVQQDRAELKRLVESYGKEDVLNFVNHLDEGIGSFMRRTFAGNTIEEKAKKLEEIYEKYRAVVKKLYFQERRMNQNTYNECRKVFDNFYNAIRRVKKGEKVSDEEIQKYCSFFDKTLGTGSSGVKSKATMSYEEDRQNRERAENEMINLLRSTRLGQTKYFSDDVHDWRTRWSKAGIDSNDLSDIENSAYRQVKREYGQ